jgi:hypothetical protein
LLPSLDLTNPHQSPSMFHFLDILLRTQPLLHLSQYP